MQNPKLEKLLKANKSRGLEVLALVHRQNAAEVPKYMQQHGYTGQRRDDDARVAARARRPEGLPVIWVIGRDGKVKQDRKR